MSLEEARLLAAFLGGIGLGWLASALWWLREWRRYHRQTPDPLHLADRPAPSDDRYQEIQVVLDRTVSKTP